MKAILLNGPPRSGKDTSSLAIENYLSNRPAPARSWNVLHEKFSRPLKTAFAGMMGLRINEDFVVEHYEARKQEIVPELGVSFRKWQQDFSEKFMKPLYGNDVFPRLLMGRVHQEINRWDNPLYKPDFVVISDCGFQIEVDYLVESKTFTDILLIKTIREGCSYEGDTRDAVWLKEGRTALIDNSSSIEVLQELAALTVERWLEDDINK